MALNLQNLERSKSKLLACDVTSFSGVNGSFKYFLSRIQIDKFRHLSGLSLSFSHPCTVISGQNKIGKTSLLLLMACSHERFLRLDSTSPTPSLHEHGWKDVLSLTSHEDITDDYTYTLEWRVGSQDRKGEGKRLASTKSWSGLGKKSSDSTRLNAKIRDREVRLIDLERILPARSFTASLFRKANIAAKTRLGEDIEKAFSYIFRMGDVEISEAGAHINKSCFIIKFDDNEYSTFNAASSEESVIYLLKDIMESDDGALILIDEVEAGFHPEVQRRLADIIQYISWRDKKQFIITTHSPTLMSAFPPSSRRFIEKSEYGDYRVIDKISQQAAMSKMDSIGYPLVRLYCEDDLSSFLCKSCLTEISQTYLHFHRLVNIIESGPADQVKNDYERHKRNLPQYVNKIGYCAVFDGDMKDNPAFSSYFGNSSEFVHFIYPYDAPEKFLVKAYLGAHSNTALQSALAASDHHILFQEMVNLGLAADKADARSKCFSEFKNSPEYTKYFDEIKDFIIRVVWHFSETQGD